MSAADHPGVIVRPPVLYAAALGSALALRWWHPFPIGTHAATLWPGSALLVLGLGLIVWGRRTLLAAGTAIDPKRPTTVLVTGGPFRHSRNPLYGAVTGLFIGLTLVADTWWGIGALLPVLVVMHYGVVLREERYLEAKFGDAYHNYRISVRRYMCVQGPRLAAV